MKRSAPWDPAEKTATSDDESSDSDSSSEEDEPGSTKTTSKANLVKKQGAIDYISLSKHGYKGGLSVLKVPPPKIEEKQDWSWSTGREGDAKAEEESFQERERTRAAVADGELLLNVQKNPFVNKRQEKAKSFSQKEKKKRDLGQASRGKNYVEEEKRLLRNSGVYSGFD